MRTIPGFEQHVAGIIAGGIVGIGAGAAIMHALGPNAERRQSWDRAQADVPELTRQRAELQRELDTGRQGGSMTLSREAQLEHEIELLDTQLSRLDSGSRLVSENWPLALGIPVGLGGRLAFEHLDHHNWRWTEVVTNPGWNAGSLVPGMSPPTSMVGRETALVKDARIRYSLAPGLVVGLAAGVVLGMIGARILQERAAAA